MTLVVAVTLVAVTAPTEFAEAAVKIGAPATHDHGWREEHASLARANIQTCYTCHDQSYCTACHNSDNPKEGYHKTNYVYSHYLDKFIDERDCAACHDRQNFCVSCHEETGGRPANHATTGWMTSGHAAVAAAEIDTCASCHDASGADPVCMRCHRSGISPHGENTVTRMGRGPWHEDKGYVCYRCHSAGDEFCSKCHEDRE